MKNKFLKWLMKKPCHPSCHNSIGIKKGSDCLNKQGEWGDESSKR